MTWMEKISWRLAKRIKMDETPYSIGQLAHGIEIVLLNILNVIALFVTSALLQIVGEVFLVTALFFFHRLLSGGVHLKNPWTCMTATLLLMNAGGYLVKHLSATVPPYAALLAGVGIGIAFLINYRYAPAEHTYVSTDPKIQQKNRVIILNIVGFCCILSLFLVEYVYQLVIAYMVAILTQSILLLPVSFQIANRLEKHFERMVVK
ncbi:accessory gene regulator ArgB-like protein [Brevibacillus sp. TJ4]|uniref:accessory gene regulator ArgB-like protein n=1 Tax=Brevibacillus sp. TJ4 TaxID=3234853 RepID=UPI0037CE0863